MTKKVLLVANKDKLGGAESCMLNIGSKLSDFGWQPYYFIPGQGEVCDAALKQANRNQCIVTNKVINFYTLSTLESFILLGTLLRVLLKLRPNIVYCHSSVAARSFTPLCKLLNIKVVCHVHCKVDEQAIAWQFNHHPTPCFFFYPSASTLSENHPIYERVANTSLPAKVVFNGIQDIANKTPTETQHSNAVKLGYLANFEAIKGHENLLKTLRLLLDKGLTTELHLFGEDKRNENRQATLEALINELELQQYVHFHGFVNNTSLALEQIDIYICPSLQEEMPISIIEAFRSALPVVSTNVGGISEMIVSGENGFLFEPGDNATAADLLAPLVEHSAFRQHIGDNARQQFLKHFQLSVMVKSIVDELDNISGTKHND